MISDNAIPHCGLELGCCDRQIPYDLLAHDKMVHEEGYQQGRNDAIDECVRTIRNFAPDCVKLLEQLKEQTE